MPELEVRLPYAAWGADEEWESGSEELMNDLCEALQESGIGDDDDPDHADDHISYFLMGDDVPALARLAGDVLARHGVLEHASALVVDQGEDPSGSDRTETVVPLPAPREQ